MSPVVDILSSREFIPHNALKTARLDLTRQTTSLNSFKDKLTTQNEQLQESLKGEQLKTVILTLKDAGATAIKEQSYDKAIEILADTNKKNTTLNRSQCGIIQGRTNCF